MTNGDKIRSMTDEDLRNLFSFTRIACCSLRALLIVIARDTKAK